MSLSKLNYVNAGTKGTFKASGDFQSTPADVDAIIDHLRTSGKQHVVVHLHGGLISESKGMAIAEKMIAPYEAAGAHPVSLVYETGFMETLLGNLRTIHETKLFGKLLKYARKYVAKKLGVEFDGLEGAGDAEPDLERPAKELESHPWFTVLEEAAADGKPEMGLEGLEAADDEVDQEEIEDWLMDDDEMRPVLLQDLTNPVVNRESLDAPGEGPEGLISWGKTAWTILKVGKRVVTRLWTKRDHGAYCTLVEELLREAFLADFGQWTWDAMKQKAHDLFSSNVDVQGTDQHAGRYLADALAALQAENSDFKVDIVGHSLGTVAACELLDATAGSLTIRNIAFLAPAVRTDVAHASLVAKPERFEKFRLFTMSDKYEVDDELLGVVYPRSLLYLISGALEKTEVDETIFGMARHLTGVSPYDEDHLMDIVAYLRDDPSRAVWSVTDTGAPAGHRSTSEDHGGFDDDDETRASLTHFLQS
ncbi:MAG: alpha/beta hydrolase [Woeseiaceae bacterium]|nr:alpha/beta hydrolase [Woeseiaceae bacterium]